MAEDQTSESVSVELRKPINVMGEQTSKLTFREPTAGDIERYGFPLIFEEDATPVEVMDVSKSKPPRIRFDEKKMTGHIAVLSGVPIESIRRLTPNDWLSCAYRLSGFFL